MTAEPASAQRLDQSLDLRNVIDTIPALVVCALPDGSVEFVNQGWREFTGFPLEKLSGWGWQTVIHPDDLRKFVDEWDGARAAGKPFENEARVRRADGEFRWFLIRKVPLRDPSGQIVSWYGTGHDIETLKRAEDGLRLVVDTTPALMHTARPDGYIDFLNKGWLEYVGLPMEDALGWLWTKTFHPDDVDECVKIWRAALASGQPFEAESRVRRADGQYRTLLHRKVPLRDAQGRIVKWYGSAIDIEDRKRAEDALKKSEACLAHAQQLTKAGSWAYKPPDVCEYWSPEMFRIFGYDPSKGYPQNDEMIGRVHPEDRQRSVQAVAQLFEQHLKFDQKYRFIRPDGQVRVIQDFGTPIFENGAVTRFVGACMDITEQEQKTEELRRSEFYLAEGERLAHTGSWAFSPSGFFDHWSRELSQIYGLDPSSKPPTLDEYLALMHSEDRASMAATIQSMLAESSGCDLKKRIVRPDGEIRYIRCVGVSVVDNGKLKRIVGTAIDVTDEEHLTQELRRREAYLAEAQKLSHTGSFGWSVKTGEIVWSDETFRIFELDPSTKPSIGLILQRLHPDDRARLQKIIDHAPAGDDFEIEYRLLMPDGRVKSVHALAHASIRSSGELEFVGAATDITHVKQAEEALRLSESYLVHAQQLTKAGSWAYRAPDLCEYWSEEMFRIFGFDPSKGCPPSAQFLSLVHPDDRKHVEEAFTQHFEHGRVFDVKYRITRPDGQPRVIRDFGTPIIENGVVTRSVGASLDITEHEQRIEALRKSEEQWRHVFENNPTMYFMVDAAGTVLAVNPFGAEQLGYNVDELVGQPVLSVFYKPDREAVQRKVAECLKQLGQSMSWELRKVRKDGSVLWVRETARAVLRDNAPVVLIACEDITERKSAEEKIRQSEMELRQVLDLSSLHIAEFGPDGSRLYVNRVALDYRGITLEQWKSADLRTLFHPQDAEHLAREIPGKFLSGTAFETEGRFLRKDGQYRWFLMRYNPLRDEQGRLTRWFAAGTDIEDRKQAEQRLQDENVALREEIDKASMFEEIVGTSSALQTVLSRVSKVAPTDSTVLITGETGTGKELVARAIHKRSQRSSRAFVSVNCAAIPRDLIASELFGHEKGAFTGATQQRLGRFELAGGGTIFFDEVGELPAETQVALLRVLQEHEFERVGGNRSIQTDVRVIAATNRDLQAAIAVGTFRSDLFYRLNVFPLNMPSLRERKQDISLLVEYFIDRYARKAGKNIRVVSKTTLDLLLSYPWPGNIRELQNVIERSVILCETENFSVDESWLSRAPSATAPITELDLAEKLAAQEKEIIEAALRETEGRVFGPSGAAAKLGMPRSTLESKIRTLKINKNQFKT